MEKQMVGVSRYSFDRDSHPPSRDVIKKVQELVGGMMTCKVAITGIYRYEDGAVSIDFRCEAGCEHSFYIHPDAKLQLVDLAPLHGEDAK